MEKCVTKTILSNARAAASVAVPLAALAAALACLAGVRGVADSLALGRAEALRLHADAVRESRARHAEEIREILAARESAAKDLRGIRGLQSSLLDEQRKRTIDGVFAFDEVRRRCAEGISLYGKGDYAGAIRAISPVRPLARDDDEAIFCLVASEFRINPLDRERYREITGVLRDLRAGGFRNGELEEIIAYIEAEQEASRE